MNIKEITKEEINNYTHFLTVGDLKKFLSKHDLPDNAPVLIERVEDVYYEKHDWGVYLKEGEHTVNDENGNIVKESLKQYHPAWCCVRFKDDSDILFIDLHY
jgi:hypothetical protein